MSQDAITLEGGKKLRALTDELPKRVRTKGMRQGVTAAAAPVVKATKAGTPTESKLLKKAVTKKTKTYRGGDVVVAIVGANKEAGGEWKGKKRVPVNYFHLIEDGAAPHAVSVGTGSVAHKHGLTGSTQHPGTTAHHMLQKGYDSTKDAAGGIMLTKYQTVLESEAAKLAAA